VSSATNLVDGDDANGVQLDIYVYRRADGHLSRVSTTADGRQPAVGSHFDATISGDGRLVAFTSTAELNCPGAPRDERSRPRIAFTNMYSKELDAGRLTCVSRAADRGSSNGVSDSPSLDGNGTWIAYVTDATNLGYRDGNGARDVVVQDLRTGRVRLISHDDRGLAANGPSWHPVLSATGQYVAFVSSASDLLCWRRCSPADMDLNLVPEVYLFDTISGNMRRLSTDGTGEWWAASRGPAFDKALTVVALSSSQPISPSDLTGDEDLFILAL
jgi:Tol biopolymer transport system component